MLYHQLGQFAFHHWALVTAFVIATAALLIEESKSQKASHHLNPLSLTHLINRESPVLIDIRDKELFKQSHVIGAQHIQADKLKNNTALLEKHRDQSIVIIDGSGTQADAIASQLKKANFEKIFILKGGMTAWVNAEMPTVSDKKIKSK